MAQHNRRKHFWNRWTRSSPDSPKPSDPAPVAKAKGSLSLTNLFLRSSSITLGSKRALAPVTSVAGLEMTAGTPYAEDLWKDIDAWDAALKKSEGLGDLGDKRLEEYLAVLASQFDDFRNEGKAIRNVVTPIFTVLVKLIRVAGEAAAVVNFSSKAVAGAIAILFDETKNVTTAYNQIERLFRHLNSFFVRLSLYGEDTSPQLRSVLDAILRHTVEILVIGARMIKNGRMLQYVSGLAGLGTDYQTAMEKMEELTQREIAIVHAENYSGIKEINARHTSSTNSQPALLHNPVLPSRPHLVIGRASEIESLVDALLTVPTPRLAILGPGGMGKTTLALTVLHDDRLSPRWKLSNIYFVDCEGVTSAELLVKELADVLRIPPNRRDSDVFDAVLHALAHQPAILCLDNFETPWEDLSIRPSIEKALQRLDGLHNLALLVTMRGIQRPAALGIKWLRTLEPLKQLDSRDAQLLFATISHQMDPWSDKLVIAVDCVPLAVTLLAQLVLEGTETTESLWGRWTKEWTAIIENGGQDRLSKLDTSIQLSLSKLNASTGQILRMLALLPDGLVASGELTDTLQTRIPKEINLKAGLTVLERKALIFRSGNRYQMLSPIRHFTLQHSTVSTGVQRVLIKTYIAILLKHRDFTDAASYSIVRPETSNFRNILTLAFEMGDIPNLSNAAIVYTYILMYTGLASADIIQRALHIPCLAPEAQADCLRCLGKLHMDQDELDDAEQSLKRALGLHEQAQSIIGQANDHQELGRLYMRRGELDNAEHSLKRALQLHEQAQSIIGQANDHQELGTLHRRRGALDNAEQSLKRALGLHEQINNILGQAHGYQELGTLHMHRGALNDAEQSLKRALGLHEQVYDVLGQANDHHMLGKLHMHRDELDEAEKSLKQALGLHEQINDILGQANDHQILGTLHMRRNALDDAEQSLERALGLHEQVHNVRGQANDHHMLGKLQMHRGALNGAEKSLKQALGLHEQVHDGFGQANDFHVLGMLHMHQDKLDKAKQSLEQGLKLYEQVHNVLGQAHGYQELGKLHMRRNVLDDAEQSLNRALKLYEQIQNVLGQAYIRSELITLSARRSDNRESNIN